MRKHLQVVIGSWLFLAGGCGSARAEEASWAIRDSANRLLKKHVLMLPAGDWFVQFKDGSVHDYQLPGMQFEKFGEVWRVQIISARFRYHYLGRWKDWDEARPEHDFWRIATLEVRSPATGGSTAYFLEGQGHFDKGLPPSESMVRKLLETAKDGVLLPPKIQPPAAAPIPPPKTAAMPPEPPAAPTTPSTTPESERGIFRIRKDGTRERVGP